MQFRIEYSVIFISSPRRNGSLVREVVNVAQMPWLAQSYFLLQLTPTESFNQPL